MSIKEHSNFETKWWSVICDGCQKSLRCNYKANIFGIESKHFNKVGDAHICNTCSNKVYSHKYSFLLRNVDTDQLNNYTINPLNYLYDDILDVKVVCEDNRSDREVLKFYQKYKTIAGYIQDITLKDNKLIANILNVSKDYLITISEDLNID
jgi:hypothetical protein